MKVKGLEEYLADDSNLQKEVTYQEYQKKQKSETDHSIEDAYEEFRRLI